MRSSVALGPHYYRMAAIGPLRSPAPTPSRVLVVVGTRR